MTTAVIKRVQDAIHEWDLWQLCAAMMSWVGCLLTYSVLPDKWKLGE